jgi:hypothetical protein
MDEMELLTRFRAAVAPPDEGTLSEARARMLASGGAAAPLRGPWRRGPGHPPRRTRPWLAPAGAAAVVTAVAVGAVAVSGATSHQAGTSVRLTAATVLHRAASAALTAPLPGKNQYIYALTLGGPGRKLNSVIKQWVSVDGKRRSWAWTNDCGIKADPRCILWLEPVPSPTDFFTYSGLRKLPSAPDPLLGYLARQQVRACAAAGIRMGRAGTEWSGIFTILADVPVLPPHFGAALFDAAAKIPGVTVIRNARTGTGQRGIAVARSVHPVESQKYPYAGQAELIFNARTYRYMGSVYRYGGAFAPGSSTLVTTRFVDSAPTGPTADIMPVPECVAFL